MSADYWREKANESLQPRLTAAGQDLKKLPLFATVALATRAVRRLQGRMFPPDLPQEYCCSDWETSTKLDVCIRAVEATASGKSFDYESLFQDWARVSTAGMGRRWGENAGKAGEAGSELPMCETNLNCAEASLRRFLKELAQHQPNAIPETLRLALHSGLAGVGAAEASDANKSTVLRTVSFVSAITSAVKAIGSLLRLTSVPEPLAIAACQIMINLDDHARTARYVVDRDIELNGATAVAADYTNLIDLRLGDYGTPGQPVDPTANGPLGSLFPQTTPRWFTEGLARQLIIPDIAVFYLVRFDERHFKPSRSDYQFRTKVSPPPSGLSQLPKAHSIRLCEHREMQFVHVQWADFSFPGAVHRITKDHFGKPETTYHLHSPLWLDAEWWHDHWAPDSVELTQAEFDSIKRGTLVDTSFTRNSHSFKVFPL